MAHPSGISSVFRWRVEQARWVITDPFGWDPWAGPEGSSRDKKQQEDPLVWCNDEVSYDLWVNGWPQSVGAVEAIEFAPKSDRYVGGWLGDEVEPVGVSTATPAQTREAVGTTPAADQSDPQEVVISFMEALVAGDCATAAVYMDPTQRETLQTKFCTSGSGGRYCHSESNGTREETSLVAQQDIELMGEIKTRFNYDSSTSEEQTYSLCRASLSQWNGKWYIWQLIFQGRI